MQKCKNPKIKKKLKKRTYEPDVTCESRNSSAMKISHLEARDRKKGEFEISWEIYLEMLERKQQQQQ